MLTRSSRRSSGSVFQTGIDDDNSSGESENESEERLTTREAFFDVGESSSIAELDDRSKASTPSEAEDSNSSDYEDAE